ncbi:MAG: hypothetical protein ACREJ2_00265 [Planctomycetota bacterium]
MESQNGTAAENRALALVVGQGKFCRTHPDKFRKLSSLLVAAGACVLGAPLLARAANAGAATAAASGPAAREAQPQLQQVIISATPLQDFGLPLNEIPSAVQTLSAADLERQQSLDLVDYLDNSFSGINVSGSAGNPFQINVY